MKSSLVLHNLELSVRLGCLPAEKLQDQVIAVDINLQFPQPPLGCTTDHLADTFCYDILIEEIKKSILAREFHLIEYLGQEIYHIAKKNISNEKVLIGVRIKKKPLIMNLTGGVSFYYGDEDCTW